MRLMIYIASVLLLFQCKAVKWTAPTIDSEGLETRLYVDELDQIYTISASNTILKHDEKGEVRFEYSDNTLGAISVFDVSNPMQILAFHKDFQVVKIFDRTLTLNSKIDLNQLNLFEIKTVASANDNRIWIFDELNQELLKIDKGGKIQGRNNDLRLRLQENASPYQMIDFQNKVYLFDAKHGVLIFNAFGEYVNQRPFSHLGQFTYSQGKLFYLREGTLIAYDLRDGSEEVLLQLDSKGNKDAYYQVRDKLIYLEDDKIIIKSI